MSLSPKAKLLFQTLLARCITPIALRSEGLILIARAREALPK